MNGLPACDGPLQPPEQKAHVMRVPEYLQSKKILIFKPTQSHGVDWSVAAVSLRYHASGLQFCGYRLSGDSVSSMHREICRHTPTPLARATPLLEHHVVLFPQFSKPWNFGGSIFWLSVMINFFLCEVRMVFSGY